MIHICCASHQFNTIATQIMLAAAQRITAAGLYPKAYHQHDLHEISQKDNTGAAGAKGENADACRWWRCTRPTT
jgi:hypothetical protein